MVSACSVFRGQVGLHRTDNINSPCSRYIHGDDTNHIYIYTYIKCMSIYMHGTRMTTDDVLANPGS